jgi:hypothetical protein
VSRSGHSPVRLLWHPATNSSSPEAATPATNQHNQGRPGGEARGDVSQQRKQQGWGQQQQQSKERWDGPIHWPALLPAALVGLPQASSRHSGCRPHPQGRGCRG